ncbi:MAG: HD domain-containing protein [Clostridiales bacterium]|nr:HD domain-containing protein [Clostridiales bacterium]
MAKKLVAVIDIGSITARLKIFEVGSKNGPKVIEAVRKVTLIGTYSYRSGKIEKSQLDEICDCLLGFDVKLREYKVSKVICVATAALRNAGNREVIVEQVRIRTGFKIEILDNSMERFYQNLAVEQAMPEFPDLVSEGTMILDIGSNSLQATVYDKGEFVFSQNMVLGSLRIYEMLSDLQTKTTHYEDVLEEFIAQDLEDYHAVEPKGIVYKHMIAFGGEMGYIKYLAGLKNNESCIIDKDLFLKVYDYLIRTSPSELTLNNRIPSNVSPLLLPAALIIKNMMEYTGADRIHMPHASMSDGIVYAYYAKDAIPGFSKKIEEDMIRAARNVAKRYKTDRKHIEFVEKAAMEIFDASSKVTGLKSRERLLLRLSAILHEVGKYVHATDHNEAAYALIKYTDLIGLDSDELDIIANVVRLYAKQDPYENYSYQNLPTNKKIMVSKLTAILRVADSMDASHRQKVKKVTVTASAEKLQIVLEASEDMSFEQWSFEHRSVLFEEVIGIKPQLRVRRLM